MHSYTKTYGDKMKAVDFIKAHGWEKAISVRNDFCDGFYLFSLANGYVDKIAGFQLSEYIDACELVQSYGGLKSCYEKLYMLHELTEDPEPIRKAIALVEEINDHQ